MTVDHLQPRALGGGDELDNLMLAHALCNSFRGVRDEVDIRYLLSGLEDPPRSAGQALGLAALSALGVGAAAGELFSTTRPDGSREFNWGAAGVAALLAASFAYQAA